MVDDDTVRVQVVKSVKRPTYRKALEEMLGDKRELEKPRYWLLQPFFDEDNTLWDADQEIYYGGCPNDAMEPRNEPAYIRVKAWEATFERGRISLEDAVAEAYANRPREPDTVTQSVQPVNRPTKPPQMGVRTKGRSTVEKIAAPEADGNIARRRGRPPASRGEAFIPVPPDAD